jgi:hypothetical protein
MGEQSHLAEKRAVRWLAPAYGVRQRCVGNGGSLNIGKALL